MDRFFLEELWRLLVCWAGIQFVLICLWSWTRSRHVAYANWTLLALMPVLSGLSTLIQTPAEQVIETCRRVARAVDDGDMTTLAAHLAADLRTGGTDRAVLLERLEKTLTRVRVDKPRLRGFEVSVIEEGVVEALFRASCQIRTPELTRPNLPSKWRIRFRRNADLWQITEIESLPVPPTQYRILGDWLR